MIVNERASVVSMAKALRMGLDPSKADVTLPRAQLGLLLDTLIDMAEEADPHARKQGEAHLKAVGGQISRVEQVMGVRDAKR